VRDILAEHIAVMAEEAVEFLVTYPDGVYLDCTLGAGGHSEKILEKLGSGGKLIGIDRDRQAVGIAEEKLKKYADKTIFVNDNFINLEKIVQQYGLEKVDGILFDLGVSSMHLSSPERGFSFRLPGPLDMRMNQTDELTANQIVNEWGEDELYQIFHNYGEERWAGRIARAIVREREKKPLWTTTDLVNLIFRATPKMRTRTRIHPATRVFQSLRIVVNRELENLKEGLIAAEKILKSSNQNNGGRIVVIAYHSLEDRMVKHFFRERNFKILTPHPVRPKREEIKTNPRARSARLRAAEKKQLV
jgi:16S rRNA (cytosine1402-N4)-methyltransferase